MAAAATSLMRFALNPTISSRAHEDSTSGSSVKRLSEQNNTRNLLSRDKSSGSVANELPDRFSTSRLSANSKISGGNSSRSQARSSLVIPCSSPERKAARVALVVVMG